ncbi:Arc/MetJ-type ribon-helix-helix transcriptional regulator [Duganella sp. 3397]|uniref:Uncharacterized protein n=1 Tax=Duganella phyllosphaerae TaxID=762836 RepID=A0A1E7W8W0_9BURK|nr:Arc/MetJ-type ribon-helix-helix transcriptional regulator [Duganella sp. 3397]OEZ92676.1 hypothetical protein DUPY_49370 [Duganella phyllosphaerae]
MTTTRQLSITLPLELADAVQAKVATGEYGTESEVIHSALSVYKKNAFIAFAVDDANFEYWY